MKNIYRDSDYYNDLRELVEGVGKKYGDMPAFRYNLGGKKLEITYKGFKSDVEALGTYFIKNGFTNKKIAVVGENSYEWVVTYFAAVNSGNIILPFDKELKPNEIKVLLNKSETDLLVYAKEKLRALKCPTGG